MAVASCSGRTLAFQQNLCSLRPASSRHPVFGRGCRQLSIRAASGEANSPEVKPQVPMISSKQIGAIPFIADNETFTDVMAFTGPAPERVNGRVAMWAFLICSLTELTSGLSVTQQALAHPVGATFLSLTISLASLAPKYVSGVPLAELQDSASREGLPEKLRFFNKTHEIWLGRVAMLGILGLAGLEVFLGRALFAR